MGVVRTKVTARQIRYQNPSLGLDIMNLKLDHPLDAKYLGFYDLPEEIISFCTYPESKVLEQFDGWISAGYKVAKGE